MSLLRRTNAIPFFRPVSECTGMRTVRISPNSEKNSLTVSSSASKLRPPTNRVFEALGKETTEQTHKMHEYAGTSGTGSRYVRIFLCN
jgi:hypothetical protein